MTPTFASKLKRSTFEAFLDFYGRVGVVVAVGGGAIVPEKAADENGLILLDIWPTASVPVTDLVVDDEAVMATLSVARTPFQVVVPWVQVRAVQAPTDHLALVHSEPGEAEPPPKNKGFRLIEGGA